MIFNEFNHFHSILHIQIVYELCCFVARLFWLLTRQVNIIYLIANS